MYERLNIPKQGYLALDLLTPHDPAHATVLGLPFPVIWVSVGRTGLQTL